MLIKEHNNLSDEIDLKHPLSRGLVYAQESINPYHELARGVKLIAPLAGVSRGVTTKGKATVFSGTQAANSTGVTSWNGMEGATEGTWEILVYFDEVSGITKFFGQWDTSNRWLLALIGSTLFWVPCETPARTRYDVLSAATTPGWYHFVLSWRGQGKGASVFINGRSFTPSTISDGGVSITSTTNPIQIGGSGSAPMTGKALFGRAWRRALSDSECLSLSNDPWQIYRPLQRSLFPASGGTTFTITPSGSIVFTGTNAITSLNNFTITPSGGVIFSGANALTFESGATEYIITPSGGLIFSGSNQVISQNNYSITPDGGVTLSGTNTITGFTPDSFTLTPSGGIVFSGDNTFIVTKIMDVSGGIVFEGTNAITSNTVTVSTRLPLTGVGK